MEKYLPILTRCRLFAGLSDQDLSSILACLGARVTAVSKNQSILSEGDRAVFVGIVLSGSVQILKEDFYGNRSIVAVAEPGELFGETFACAGVTALPVSVVAVQDSQIMLIDCQRLTRSCSNACSFHNQLVLNLLQVVASKNLFFNQKLEILSKRTTRDKLMAYLTGQAKLRGSSSFTIPYDRQALADYLGVERSAMSAEISKLRKDGIIDSTKNRFTLL